MTEKNINTLLIDDDKNLLTSLSDILEYKGFIVHRAETGKQALQLMETYPADVAMIDLRLQDIPGLELLKEIKKSSPTTECILLTGYASQSSAIDAIQSGAFGYFQKPFDIEQVVLSIQQAGEKSQSARALAASERRLRALIEYGRDNIILISKEGRVFWASPSISEIWGYPQDSIQDEDIFELIHPEEQETLIPLLQQLIKEPGSRVDRQFRVLRGDGVWRWAEGSAVNLLEDPSVGGIVINFRDITEQKAINDRLWLQGSALEAAANAILIADFDGNVIWINPAFTRLTGYSLEETMGENPRFLNSGEQSQEFYKQLWDTIRNGNVWQSELINKKKDGTKYIEEMTITPLVDKDGSIEYFIAIKQDISQRKQIERTLSLSEARYRSIFEESPVAIREEDFSSVIEKLAELKKKGVKDFQRYFAQHPKLVAELARQVRISDVNKAATKIYGVTSKDQLPLNLSEYFTDTSTTMFIETLINLAEGKSNFSYENVNTTFDGSLINVIVYVSVTPGHEQDLSKVLVSIIDITNLKQAEEGLRRKNLMQEKIVSLGRELAASMDLTVIYRTAEKYIRSMVSCSGFGISMFDSENNILTPVYFTKNEKPIDLQKIPPQQIAPGQANEDLFRAISLKNPVIVKSKDYGKKKRSSGEHRNTESFIYIPMQAEDKVLGLIELSNEHKTACSAEYIDWLSVVANQMGLAIQNARLNEDILRELIERKRAETEIRQNLAELEMLYDNALVVNQLLDPDEIGKSMIALFTRYFPMHHAVIRLRVGNTDDLRIAAFHVPGLKESDQEKVAKRFSQLVGKVGEGLSGWAVKTGQSLRVSDVTRDPHYVDTYPGIRSGIYIPIMTRKRILGSIAIESEIFDAFDERDERLLITIANQAAIAFENARLYQEVQKELEERKSTESALRISQGRLQSILDNTTAWIYIKDLESRFLVVNRAMSKLYKIPESKLIGMKEIELSPREVAEQFIRNDQIVIEKRAPMVFEETLVMEGEWHTHISFKFPLWDEDGSVNGVGGISTDITEQRKSEEQIFLLSYAIDQSPVSIALTDNLGNLEYANKQFLKEARRELGEIKGKNLRDLNPDLISDEEFQELFNVIQSGKEWHGEYQDIDEDGKTYWESVSISPVYDRHNKITHFLEIIEDTTTRKEAELAMMRLNTELEERVKQRTEELHAANISLEKASKLKDEFLASMSHELRTPLTGVLGLSEALQKGIYGSLNEKQMNILFTIEDGGRHLLNLINDILDLSKIEAGKTELQFNLTDVEEICQASMRMVKQIAVSKSQKVSLRQNPTGMMIYADPRRLKQILVNLLGNAVKFTPENGELGLEVTGDEDADMIHFTVWDKGIGIDPENIQKLFQPFVQLDSSLSRSYAGTGLGLSLVDRLTHLHGGSVEVKSVPGQGSQFTISIPWKKKKIDEITTAGSYSSNLSGFTPIKSRSQTELGLIVLIDDNEINNGMLSDYLSFQGYSVESAVDGKQGLDLIVNKKPKLILMDIQMPGIDGLEAIRRIRTMSAEYATIPIIALTALAMEEDRQRCLDAGADDYVPKPVNLNELSNKIKRLMEKNL